MNSRNLIPPRRQAQQRRGRAIRRWALINASYLALLIVAGIAYAVSSLSGNSADDGQDGSERSRNLNPTLVALRQKVSRLQADVQTVAEVEDRPDWSLLLNPVSAALGDEVVLSSLRFAGTASESADAGNATKPNALQLGGMGRSYRAVTDFVLRLEQLHYFQRVQLVRTSPGALRAHDSVSFEVACTLPGRAEGH